MTDAWLITGVRDTQSVTPDWQVVDQPAIDGVAVRAVGNVLGDQGWLTEVWRQDWDDGHAVGQVFQKVLAPGGLSAWHAHAQTVDRLACAYGRIKLVLFDARSGSPSAGAVAVLRLGQERPATVLVPPGVWHGVQSIGDGPAILVNVVDRAYSYQAPDHYRLPPDTDQIPYRFT
ncbi:dTDP-4-dehydrorhamnose 3,5-epimerase family protein [Zavarzinia sp. CC-PAN008]|uniref:dTDP-4-dehydrorhamnose 3,5-epimerase family protein n=1 Tax=Zavarzinia sp. CC-PAN008 TaxID=3243332 RepID=UPI003F747D6C